MHTIVGAAVDLSADAKRNEGWNVTSNEAILLKANSDSTPILLLTKGRFQHTKVEFTVESDAKDFKLRSGAKFRCYYLSLRMLRPMLPWIY